MPETTDAAPIYDHSATLGRLFELAQAHLLSFRLTVGQTLLTDLFGGDAAAYASKDRTKAARFNDFLRQHGERLREVGLGETTLRGSIVMAITAQGLPTEIVNQLNSSQLVELARVSDPSVRETVAYAAVRNGWSVRQLRGAIEATARGEWIDNDPTTPGIQPPEPADGEEAAADIDDLPPGRVATRLHKAAHELGALQSAWSSLAPKARDAHLKKVKEAIGTLRAHLVALESALPEG